MAAPPKASAPSPLIRELRTGPRYWLHSYLAMLRYDVTAMRTLIPVFVLGQIVSGAGTAIMYGFFIPGELTLVAATWLATGAPSLALIPVGLVMVPAIIANQKAAQTFEFLWSLPVPRTTAVMSIFTIYTLGAVPGLALAQLVALWRFNPAIAVSPAIVPAVLLVGLTGTALGYAIAHAVAPMLATLIGNVVIFFVLLFTPIVYPIEQLPGWFQTVHRVLPFHHMAVVMRAGLSEGLVADVGRSYAVLSAWLVAAWALAAWVVGRRR